MEASRDEVYKNSSWTNYTRNNPASFSIESKLLLIGTWRIQRKSLCIFSHRWCKSEVSLVRYSWHLVRRLSTCLQKRMWIHQHSQRISQLPFSLGKLSPFWEVLLLVIQSKYLLKVMLFWVALCQDALILAILCRSNFILQKSMQITIRCWQLSWASELMLYASTWLTGWY